MYMHAMMIYDDIWVRGQIPHPGSVFWSPPTRHGPGIATPRPQKHIASGGLQNKHNMPLTNKVVFPGLQKKRLLLSCYLVKSTSDADCGVFWADDTGNDVKNLVHDMMID